MRRAEARAGVGGNAACAVCAVFACVPVSLSVVASAMSAWPPSRVALALHFAYCDAPVSHARSAPLPLCPFSREQGSLVPAGAAAGATMARAEGRGATAAAAETDLKGAVQQGLVRRREKRCGDAAPAVQRPAAAAGGCTA